MKQITFPKFKLYAGQPVCYIQPKLDGHLTKIYKDKKGLVKAYTKNDKTITAKLFAIDHICKVFCFLPSSSVVFAELHFPAGFSTDVPTMLNNADERLQLTAFAAPMIYGQDLSYDSLPDVLKRLNKFGFDITYADTLNSCRALTNKAQSDLLTKAIERKWEGWVLKESHMTGWYKLKPVRELDAFVISVQQSFSDQHYGGLKSIGVGVYNRYSKVQPIYDLGQVGSGFEAEYRATLDIKEKRDALIDRVCEIRYDNIAANGKLLFPRFVRWRYDKDKNDCTTEQFERR